MRDGNRPRNACYHQSGRWNQQRTSTIVSALSRVVDTPEETLRLAVSAVTDAAGRDENQDVAAALAIGGRPSGGGEDFLLVVADGMGGHPAGDVASQIAMNTLMDALPTLPDDDLGLALKQAYRRANETVFRAGEEEPSHAGMGTTLTSALLHGKYATIAHVGDSRAYLLRGEVLTQVTRDHTFVAEEVAQGRITAEAARRDPRRNRLTHVIGTHPRLEGKLPDIFELTLLPGDRLLLCSDGLYDVLDDSEMRRALGEQDPGAAARQLVEAAKERGTRDNATAVVAAAIPTRVPTAATLPSPASRTGGVPGTVIAVVIAILLVVLLLLAVVVLGAPL
jgi:serine/threonine protein phosphatase PrpC